MSVEHLHPVGRVPAGHDQPQREAVEQRQLLAVHGVGDHHLAVARMVDASDFMKLRRAVDHRLVEAGEAHLHGARLDAGAVEHVLQPHAHPLGVAHGAVGPLRAGHRRLRKAARVARALVDRRQLDPRQAVDDVLEAERQRLVDMAAHRKAEAVDVDLGRDDGPVPAHVELVVGREDAAGRRPRTASRAAAAACAAGSSSLLREGRRHRPLARSAGQRQLDDRLGQRGRGGERQRCAPPRRENAAGTRGGEVGENVSITHQQRARLEPEWPNCPKWVISPYCSELPELAPSSTGL